MAQISRILLPALLTFIGGLLAGIMLAPQLDKPPGDPLDSDLRAWEQAMTEHLQLAQEQRLDLRVLLAYYQRQREQLFDAQWNQVEPQLIELDQRFERLIQERILTSAQRETVLAQSNTASRFPSRPAPR